MGAEQLGRARDRTAQFRNKRGALSASTRGAQRIQDVSLQSVQGKEFFVAELDDALREERVDLTVHSMKDLFARPARPVCPGRDSRAARIRGRRALRPGRGGKDPAGQRASHRDVLTAPDGNITVRALPQIALFGRGGRRGSSSLRFAATSTRLAVCTSLTAPQAA